MSDSASISTRLQLIRRWRIAAAQTSWDSSNGDEPVYADDIHTEPEFDLLSDGDDDVPDACSVRRIFLVGYPGEMGGANTEAWHTIKLWRRYGLEVDLIPTWGRDDQWSRRLELIGCVTHHVAPENIEGVPELAESIVVSMCNGEFMAHAHRFRRLGCPIVWVNCMTFLFDAERKFFAEHGPADAMVFQSRFQRAQLEPHLLPYGYKPAQGHLIRGAFDLSEWAYQPRIHGKNEPFIIGRVSRPDVDKWSSNTWPIYGRIQYQHRRALMLGMDDRTIAKLGTPPPWAQCLPPMSMTVQDYFASLHCTLPINGGARENWPRAGLEAMAAGVPIVAENRWGWREMIEHGVTGFLGDCDEELAHYAAMLAYDEDLRLRIAFAARHRMESQWANPVLLWRQWLRLFWSLEKH